MIRYCLMSAKRGIKASDRIPPGWLLSNNCLEGAI